MSSYSEEEEQEEEEPSRPRNIQATDLTLPFSEFTSFHHRAVERNVEMALQTSENRNKRRKVIRVPSSPPADLSILQRFDLLDEERAEANPALLEFRDSEEEDEEEEEEEEDILRRRPAPRQRSPQTDDDAPEPDREAVANAPLDVNYCFACRFNESQFDEKIHDNVSILNAYIRHQLPNQNLMELCKTAAEYYEKYIYLPQKKAGKPLPEMPAARWHHHLTYCNKSVVPWLCELIPRWRTVLDKMMDNLILRAPGLPIDLKCLEWAMKLNAHILRIYETRPQDTMFHIDGQPMDLVQAAQPIPGSRLKSINTNNKKNG